MDLKILVPSLLALVLTTAVHATAELPSIPDRKLEVARHILTELNKDKPHSPISLENLELVLLDRENFSTPAREDSELYDQGNVLVLVVEYSSSYGGRISSREVRPYKCSFRAADETAPAHEISCSTTSFGNF